MQYGHTAVGRARSIYGHAVYMGTQYIWAHRQSGVALRGSTRPLGTEPSRTPPCISTAGPTFLFSLLQPLKQNLEKRLKMEKSYKVKIKLYLSVLVRRMRRAAVRRPRSTREDKRGPMTGPAPNRGPASRSPPPAPGLLEASLCKRERGPAELRRIPRRAAGAAQQLVNCSWPRACQQLAAGARFARSAARGAAQPRAGTASPRDAFKPCGKGGSRAANCCRVLYVTARGKDSRERRQLYCPRTEKTVMAGATGLTWLHGWWKLQNEVANNCMLLLLAAFFFPVAMKRMDFAQFPTKPPLKPKIKPPPCFQGSFMG